MSTSYFSLGDKLSNTDPISNSVLITGLKFEWHVAKILSAGHYPLQCLNSYIHESIHHTCFRSPVGGAISYLYHCAFQNAADLITNGSAGKDSYDVLESIVRVEAILHTMRPLAEGLALFGEFDAFPGESKSISPVFRNAVVSFGASVPNWEELRVDQVLPIILDQCRARTATRRRKENLLLQGFTTREGGYLPGYFMVKNLQHALFRQTKCDKLLDSEFYLNLLTHWFYGDFSLVEALLAKDREMSPFSKEAVIERDSINAISVAFQRRVCELFSLSAEQIERLGDLLASGSEIPWWRTSIGLDPDKAKNIEEQLIADINRLIDFTAPEIELQRKIRALCHDNIIRRNYMCLGTFDETIEILADGRLNISQLSTNPLFPVISLGASLKIGPYKGKATFDVLQSGKSGCIFYVIYSDDDLVAINCGAEKFDEEMKSLDGINLSTARCRENKAFMRETIDSAISLDDSADLIREHYREQFEDSTERMYRNWCGALMSTMGPEADLGTDPGTLLRLCGNDAGFLRAYAAVGMSARPLVSDGNLENICTEFGISAAQLKAQASDIKQRHNLNLLYQFGEYYAVAI